MIGLPVAQSETLLDEFVKLCYEHRGEIGELVLRDNRSTNTCDLNAGRR